MKERDNQFIKFISYLQIIGIILVVAGHSFHEYPDGMYGFSLLFYRMTYTFKMPMFLFVSGFLMTYTTEIRNKKSPDANTFIKSKFKRLIIPYLALSILTFLPRTQLNNMADDAVSLSFESLFKGLFFYDSMIMPFLWFIQTCFTLLVAGYFLIIGSHRTRAPRWLPYALMTTVFLILPALDVEYTTFFSFNKTIELGVYFFIGAAYAGYYNKIDRRIPWTSPLFLIASAGCFFLSYYVLSGYMYKLACALTGIAMCISIAKILEKQKIGVLDHLEGATFIIFLLSWYFNIASQQGLHHFTDFPWWVYSLISFFTGLYIPVLIYRYLQRHSDIGFVRFTAVLLGQKLPKKVRNVPEADMATR